MSNLFRIVLAEPCRQNRKTAVLVVCFVWEKIWIKTRQGPKVTMDKYFYRDFQLTSRDATLDFSQYTVGDVGCVVWDAALVLAGYFDQLSKSRSFETSKVLELGSGTGCVGLVLAALGSVVSFWYFDIWYRCAGWAWPLFRFYRGDVVLTDLPEMVPLMKRNAAKNSAALKGKVAAQAFEWGTDIQSLTKDKCGCFDIVLAADCIYYKEVKLSL